MRLWLVALCFTVVVGCGKKQPPPTVVTPPPGPAKRVAPKRGTPAPKPKPAPAQDAATTPPTPVLGTLLTPEQTREYMRVIDDSLNRAQKNIAIAQSRQPTPEQMRGISRVETFMRQAREARTQNDLVTARNFAERADLLAQELLKP